VTGTLKGYDQLLNLVLDEATEFLRGSYFIAYWCLLLDLCVCVCSLCGFDASVQSFKPLAGYGFFFFFLSF
jgi:hypothetical protein